MVSGTMMMDVAMLETLPITACAEALGESSGAMVALLGSGQRVHYVNGHASSWFVRAAGGEAMHADADAASAALARLLESQPELAAAAENGERRTFEGLWNGTALEVNTYPIQLEGESGCLLVARPLVFAGPSPRPADGALVSESEIARLTANEREVLELIGTGMKTRDIARIVHRSEKTIEARRSALGRKLGVETRGELVRLAIRSGLSRL